jgi:hypothetical protein
MGLLGLADGPQKDRSTFSAVRLRSRVPGTAGNRREQPTTSPSVFAGFPACSRLFPDYKRIGETGCEYGGHGANRAACADSWAGRAPDPPRVSA